MGSGGSAEVVGSPSRQAKIFSVGNIMRKRYSLQRVGTIYVLLECILGIAVPLRLSKLKVEASNPVSRSKKYTGQVKYLALILCGFTAITPSSFSLSITYSIPY
jgi:hypothetical protein